MLLVIVSKYETSELIFIKCAQLIKVTAYCGIWTRHTCVPYIRRWPSNVYVYSYLIALEKHSNYLKYVNKKIFHLNVSHIFPLSLSLLTHTHFEATNNWPAIKSIHINALSHNSCQFMTIIAIAISPLPPSRGNDKFAYVIVHTFLTCSFCRVCSACHANCTAHI